MNMTLTQIESLTNATIAFGEKWGIDFAILLLFAGFMGFLFWRALQYIVKLKDKYEERMQAVDALEIDRAKEIQAYFEEQLEKARADSVSKDKVFADAINKNTEVISDVKNLIERMMDKI